MPSGFGITFNWRARRTVAGVPVLMPASLIGPRAPAKVRLYHRPSGNFVHDRTRFLLVVCRVRGIRDCACASSLGIRALRSSKASPANWPRDSAGRRFDRCIKRRRDERSDTISTTNSLRWLQHRQAPFRNFQARGPGPHCRIRARRRWRAGQAAHRSAFRANGALVVAADSKS